MTAFSPWSKRERHLCLLVRVGRPPVIVYYVITCIAIQPDVDEALILLTCPHLFAIHPAACFWRTNEC